MSNAISNRTRHVALLAAAGLAGAIAASACCVVPLAFALTGVTGVWIGNLTMLSTYQPLFLVLAAVCIGFGLWRSYRISRAACEGPACGTSASQLVTKTVLWIACALLIVSATTPWWASLFA